MHPERRDEDQPGPVFRGLPPRRAHPARDAAHRHGGDAALYTALYGPRFAVQSSDAFARAIGYPQIAGRRPARVPRRVRQDGAGHLAQRRRQPRLRRRAASCRPVYPGETLSSVSEVIGLKENSNRQTGVVYVRSTGFNARGETVLDYVRWVMVRKRDAGRARAGDHVPKLPSGRSRRARRGLPALDAAAYDSRSPAPAPLGRLRGRRADRPRRRHDDRGGRAPDRDAPLPEHRQGAFRPA